MIEFLIMIQILLTVPGQSQKQALSIPPMIGKFQNQDECQKKSSEYVIQFLDENMKGKASSAEIYIQCSVNKGVQI